MFYKYFRLGFGLLMMALLITNVSEAQTKKVSYPLLSVAPLVGVQFPVSGLNDNYNPSWNAGLDFNLAVNRETSFFLNATYYNMPVKDNVAVTSNASYIGITAGPRYVFTSPSVKAKFFLEAGLGVYIFTQKEYTSATVPSIMIPSATTTNFGVNVGPGVMIPLGGTVDLKIKSKLNYSFESGGEGGSRTFVSGVMGVDFKL
jgi:hypothetical protein